MKWNDKKRNKVIHKYKIGQNVYLIENNTLVEGLIIGIEFSYNSVLSERQLVSPKYAIEIYLKYIDRRTIYKNEAEIFGNKYECVMYALEHGLVKENKNE